MVFREIPIEEFQDACQRINPDTNDRSLRRQAKRLMNKGYTLAMAIVQIADDQSALRKPVRSAPAPKSQKRSKKA
jgi:hypothetical protein